MPSVAGTEEAILHRRLTDSYFKIINEEWQPQIIDDIDLPYQVYQAKCDVYKKDTMFKIKSRRL